MEQQAPAPALPREFEMGIALSIVLSILTCNLYNIYWNYRQFQAMNRLLGREEYNFWLWLVLSIVTCFLFHVYYEYKMGSDLHAYMAGRGYYVNPNLAVIGLVFASLGMWIVSDAIYQHELNRLTR